MLTITSAAAAIISRQGKIVYLDLPKSVRSCCGMMLQECPTVRAGTPPNPEAYKMTDIGGITVFVPRIIVGDALTIDVATFLGFKRLLVEGWRYC
jgi:hypothetical protein